jgi:hypothetical protein
MNIKDIEKKIGTLSNPSKMPAFGWGISAKKCVTGTKLAKIKGTICSKCYALKGRYVFKNVFNAHEARRKAIEEVEWVDYMAELLTLKYKNLDKSKRYQLISQIDVKDVPKNLCLRVSAIKVDSPPPKFWKWTSGVHKDKKAIGRECPAYKQDGECGSCRACWSRSVKQVSYKEH